MLTGIMNIWPYNDYQPAIHDGELMQRYIMGISPRNEFLFVIVMAFGYFILGSVLSLFVPAGEARIQEIQLQFLLAYEPLALLVIGGFLVIRGWRHHHVGLTASTKDIPAGIGLCLIGYLAIAVLWALVVSAVPALGESSGSLVASDLTLASVLLVSIVNPIFEEIFVCGYAITALSRHRSMAFAINVSVAIRLAYHLYQGVAGVVTIIPIGIIFAYWYARTGRLWPIIVAHAIFDFLGLVPYVAAQ